VETWIACYTLGRPELCARVGVKVTQPPDPSSQYQATDYQITAIRPVTAEPPIGEMGRAPWYVNENLSVRTMERWCTEGEERCGGDTFNATLYVLSQQPVGWRLVAWSNDIGVTCEYPEPEDWGCDIYFSPLGGEGKPIVTADDKPLFAPDGKPIMGYEDLFSGWSRRQPPRDAPPPKP
jgi:hypothetical protein